MESSLVAATLSGRRDGSPTGKNPRDGVLSPVNHVHLIVAATTWKFRIADNEHWRQLQHY